MDSLLHRSKRFFLMLPLIMIAGLITAAPAGAKLNEYKEALTDVDATSGFAWATKPAAGSSNTWYWYFNNDYAGQNTAICYRYQVNGGTFKAPNGTNWAAPTEGGNGTLPAAGTSVCEGPVVPGDDGHAFQSLAGQSSGTLVRYCAKEYVKFSNIGWQQSAIPERCQTSAYDSGAPTAAVRLTKGGNDVSVTNDPGSVVINIDYSDTVSPPLFRTDTGVNGNNWVCTTTASACNGSSTYTFSAPCSQGTSSLTQTFACTYGSPPTDGLYFACFKVFDGTVLDHVPDNVGSDPVTTTQSFSVVSGNFSIACDSFTIDRAAPDSSITAGPGEGSTVTESTTSFSFSGSGSPSGFECSMDGGAYGACSSPYGTGTLANGAHTFRVRARDAAGNTDPTPAVRNFTVAVTPPPDTTPPDTTIDSGPAQGSAIQDPTPTFGFSANEAGSFECSIDGGGFSGCTTPHTTAALGDGSHEFRVRARDSAGNADPSPASRTFTVSSDGGNDPSDPSGPNGPGGPGDGADDKDPETTITKAPRGKGKSKRAGFEFASNEPGAFECSLDGEPFAGCSSPLTERVGKGKHVFEVRARDKAGNVDRSPAVHKWKVTGKRKR